MLLLICFVIVCCFYLWGYCSFAQENKNNKTQDPNKYKNIPPDKYIDAAVDSICNDYMSLQIWELIQIPFIVFSPFSDKENRLKIAINKVKNDWRLKENSKFYLNQAYYYYTIYGGADCLCWYKDEPLLSSLVPNEFLGLDFDEYLGKQFNIVFDKKEETRINIIEDTISNNNNNNNNSLNSKKSKTKLKKKKFKIFKENIFDKTKKKRYKHKRKRHILKLFINSFMENVQDEISVLSLKIINFYSFLKIQRELLYVKIILFIEQILNNKKSKLKMHKSIIFNKDYIKHFIDCLYIYFCGIFTFIYNFLNCFFNRIILFIEEELFLKYQVCLN